MRTNRQGTFRLTAQRHELMRQLVALRYLRTGHAYTLLRAGDIRSERAVRRLLHDFWAHGFIGRRLVVAEPGHDLLPHYEQVYWLSPAGVSLARAAGYCADDYPYVDYPYIEWYSAANGRVVLELDASQVEVVGERRSLEEQTPRERLAARQGRESAMVTFLGSVAQELVKHGDQDDRSTFGKVRS